MLEDELLAHIAGLDRLVPSAYPNPEPGDYLDQLDERSLHLAGLDASPIAGASQEDIESRQLPQFGPPFVRYAHERFSRLERMIDAALEAWSYRPQTFFSVSSFLTDASGRANRGLSQNTIVVDPPPGWTVAVHRIVILCAGQTFGSPLTNASAWWEFQVNQETLDGSPLTAATGGLPLVKTWGTRDAPHVRDGELGSILIDGTAAFAGKSITVKCQGTMIRSAEG
jgi:hypothetical protein